MKITSFDQSAGSGPFTFIKSFYSYRVNKLQTHSDMLNKTPYQVAFLFKTVGTIISRIVLTSIGT